MKLAMSNLEFLKGLNKVNHEEFMKFSEILMIDDKNSRKRW